MAMMIDKGLCVGCGSCADACPNAGIELQNGVACFTDACISCGICVGACPAEAISSRQEAAACQPSGGVWVFAQQERGEILDVAFELLGRARSLADALAEPLTAVVFGGRVSHPERLLHGGADAVILAEHDAFSEPVELPFAELLTRLITERRPSVVLYGATAFGRTLAPRVAASVRVGLTADCTMLEIDPETKLLRQTRPAFGGNLMATIVCPSARPQMATVRPGVMPKLPPDETRTGPIEVLRDVSLQPTGIRVLKTLLRQQTGSITDAQVLVVAGRGIGAKKNMQYVKRLAELLGGDYGVSRPLVDAGYAEYPHQVGQTGCSVVPKLLISLGVSGAIQHLAGIGGAKTVVAVNTDPDAPIFGACRYGWVGDCVEFAKALIAELEAEA